MTTRQRHGAARRRRRARHSALRVVAGRARYAARPRPSPPERHDRADRQAARPRPTVVVCAPHVVLNARPDSPYCPVRRTRWLTRHLLTRLDDAMKTSALPFSGHHDSIYNAVAKRISGSRNTCPLWCVSRSSSAENRGRPALRNLKLVVCDQLVLNYEYDGTKVRREDAVCYVAIRKKQRWQRMINVGTAYLEFDRRPHWFPLGRQLAQFLNATTSTASLMSPRPCQRSPGGMEGR